MHYLPISLKVKHSHIAIIGNGEAALNKLRLAVKTSAKIRLFAAAPSLELASYLIQQSDSQINHLKRDFLSSDLTDLSIIFACVNDAAKNIAIAQLAKAKNIAFNSPDNPQICTFFVPSIVDRAPVTIAISTEGAAPVLAKQIRAHIEHYLPQNIGKLASFAQNIRTKVQNSLTSMNDKRHFWEEFFSGRIATSYLMGNVKQAEALIANSLNNPKQKMGKLYIIHATEPDLLSIKAARILQLADHIYQLNGTLVDIESFNHLARRDANFISIDSHPNRPEDGEIIMQIANQVRKGHIIVVIGDASTQKRKDKIFNHLFAKNIEIEPLNSAQLHVEPTSQFSQNIL